MKWLEDLIEKVLRRVIRAKYLTSTNDQPHPWGDDDLR